MSYNVERLEVSCLYSKEFESDRWRKEIPFLNFKKEWDVKIIPPFTGAIIRFFIFYKEINVSVYLDGYDLLAYMQQPYWEIYCEQNGEPERFLLNESKEMMQRIEEILEEGIEE